MINIEDVNASTIHSKNIQKVVSLEALEILRGRCIFTKGVFDILHAGHVGLFSFIESIKGDRKVVVGLASDALTRRKKGDSRPINNESLRIQQICNFGVVDYVFLVHEDDYSHPIEVLAPVIYIKGSDTAGRDSSDVSGTFTHNPELELMSDTAKFIRWCDDGELSTSSTIEAILTRYQ